MKRLEPESFIEEGQQVLRVEEQAVAQVRALLGIEFTTAARLILELPPTGRVMVTGMGKAGIVAQKISATFSSTGTGSYYLHPTEALHGDIGTFQKADLALLVSNSGETAEILALLPRLKAIGAQMIAITSSASNTLGKHADVALPIGKISEAGDLGLAPTASTTAMMALGDALALVILRARGFTAEQFAFNHPAGSLGRSLMKVREIMRTGNEQCIVHERTSVKDALKQITLTERRPGACAIVNDSGVLTGVFTDGNLRRCLEGDLAGTQGSFLDAPITSVMGKSPKTITADQFAREALELLVELHIDQLIVVDEQRHPIGLIDIQDVARL